MAGVSSKINAVCCIIFRGGMSLLNVIYIELLFLSVYISKSDMPR